DPGGTRVTFVHRGFVDFDLGFVRLHRRMNTMQQLGLDKGYRICRRCGGWKCHRQPDAAYQDCACQRTMHEDRLQCLMWCVSTPSNLKTYPPTKILYPTCTYEDQSSVLYTIDSVKKRMQESTQPYYMSNQRPNNSPYAKKEVDPL